jgi:hypothetical protein
MVPEGLLFNHIPELNIIYSCRYLLFFSCYAFYAARVHKDTQVTARPAEYSNQFPSWHTSVFLPVPPLSPH